ncbi:MAG: hypothetical protein ACRCT8_07090 [Lacipirellulaceae bacterium]
MATTDTDPAETPTPPVPTGPRFSLRWLLGLTTIVAALAAPVPWLGEIYCTYLVYGVAAFLISVIAVVNRITFLAVLGNVAAVFVSAMGTFGSPALFIQALVTVIALLATVPWGHRKGLRVGLCVAGLLAGYSLGMHTAFEKERWFAEIAKKNPIESLKPRLVSAMTPPVQSLSTRQQTRLDDVDELRERREWSWGRRRGQAYEALHELTHRRFDVAMGFGVTRMPYLAEDSLDQPLRDGGKLPRLVGPSWNKSHRQRLRDDADSSFASGDQVGYAQSIDRTSGFLPHHVEVDPWSHDADEPSALNLLRLNLVSLLLNKAPVVYVSDRLPDMEELRGAPTRPLDDFERDALVKLRGPEDVVVVETPHADGKHVRMLGAVRAGESCLVCHETQRGALLGAFSYELVERRSD